MTGVEVLSIGEIGAGHAFNWLMAILGGGLIGLIMGFIGAAMEDNIGFGIILFIVIFIVAGTIFGFGESKPTYYIPTYKVAISDEVSMNDFMEKYEILEQDGKIYTVKEREDSNAS